MNREVKIKPDWCRSIYEDHVKHPRVFDYGLVDLGRGESGGCEIDASGQPVNSAQRRCRGVAEKLENCVVPVGEHLILRGLGTSDRL